MSGVRARLELCLHPAPPELPLRPARGDYDLNPELRPPPGTLQPAAVLVPIVTHAEPTVLFTRRTDHLPSHAGQVSFPGGRFQEGDATLLDTALRETHEETGIPRGLIEPVGYLDPYETGTGFAILPAVGILAPPFNAVANTHEVAEIFEVPLSFLLDPANRQRHATVWQGRRREYYAIPYGRHYIWGATAAMLVNLAERYVRE